MNRHDFIAEENDKATLLVGERVKFNENSLFVAMRNLDSKMAQRFADARGEIIQKFDAKVTVKWDKGDFYFGREKTLEFLCDLEYE